MASWIAFWTNPTAMFCTAPRTTPVTAWRTPCTGLGGEEEGLGGLGGLGDPLPPPDCLAAHSAWGRVRGGAEQVTEGGVACVRCEGLFIYIQ